MKKLFFITIILLISGVLFWYFFKNNKQEVKYAIAEYKTLVKAVYASGRVKPKNQVDIKSQVSGYIERLFIDDGTPVKKGQILAVIEHRVLDRKIEEVEKRIGKIEEKLKEDSDFKKAFQKELKINQEELKFLQEKLNRRLPLFSKKQISEEEIELLKSKIRKTKEKLELIKARFNDRLESLKHELKILKALKNQLIEEKERYFIRSPIDGTVLRRYVNEGDYLNHMTGKNIIATVGDLSKMETVLEVDEEYVPLLKEGMEVLISIDAFPDRVFKGKIVNITKKSDPKKRVVEVKADVNYPVSLPSELTVEANIIVERRKALSIPIRAVLDEKVKVLESGKIVEKKIKTGILSEGYVEVKEGLKEGDRVILP